MMRIRVITLDLLLPNAASLKDKRQILQSLIAKVRKFNAAVAEVAYQDQWQRAQLGLALISNESGYLDSVQQEIINLVEATYPIEITEISVSNY